MGRFVMLKSVMIIAIATLGFVGVADA